MGELSNFMREVKATENKLKEAVDVIIDMLYQTCFEKETEKYVWFNTAGLSAFEHAYAFLKKLGLAEGNNISFRVRKSELKRWRADGRTPR